MEDKEKVYVSDRWLAGRYQVARQTVWVWVQKGLLPEPVKLSPGCSRWKMEDVLEFEERRSE